MDFLPGFVRTLLAICCTFFLSLVVLTVPWVSHCRIFSCNTINYKCKVETILMTMEYWLGKKCKRVEQTFHFLLSKRYLVLYTMYWKFLSGKTEKILNLRLMFYFYVHVVANSKRQTAFVALEVKSNFHGMNTSGGMMRMLVIF